MSIIDVISDYSSKNLKQVPEEVLEMFNLKMLYLENNLIESLPENLFDRLTKLTWLDLRQNKLKTLPVGIANHLCLETLLLQDNEIECLPNEVGLLSNLKVLQVSGNPIIYPQADILERGARSICNFLKAEYEKLYKTPPIIEEDEVELEVLEPKGCLKRKKDEKLTVQQILRNSTHGQLGNDNPNPVIRVKSLTRANSAEENEKKPNTYIIRPAEQQRQIQLNNFKKTHEMTKNKSNILLKSNSYFVGKNKEKKEEENKELTEVWLKRLKDLLIDQEKILQKEKNLSALRTWRHAKKMEVPRHSQDVKLKLAPYDTNPDYNQLMSREDMSQQIDEIIKKNKQRSCKKSVHSGSDIQKLIGEVVDQMKNMEAKLSEMGSPRSEKEVAGKQIKNILDLHKTILALQATNTANL